METYGDLQRLTETIGGYRRLSEAYRGLRRLSKTIGGYRRLTETYRGLQRLMEATGGLQRLTEATRDLRRLLEAYERRGACTLPTLRHTPVRGGSHEAGVRVGSCHVESRGIPLSFCAGNRDGRAYELPPPNGAKLAPSPPSDTRRSADGRTKPGVYRRRLSGGAGRKLDVLGANELKS